MTKPRVVLISNDVVPGSAVPVAAPGLRASGLAQGLRAHGFTAEVVVVKHIVSRVWRAHVPAPRPQHTMVLPAGNLMEYLKARGPAIAVMTNSNQIDHLRQAKNISFVFDFFAPKILEMISEPGTDYPIEEVRALRRRKIEALSLADAVIVNGWKKLPYALGWLLQTDRDVRNIPTAVVPMCVTGAPRRPARTDGPLRLGIAGYVQPWSIPAKWIRELDEVVSQPDVVLDLLMPRHWGGAHAGGDTASGDGLVKLAARRNVRTRDSLTFSEYRRFLEGLDLVIDLFDHNLEREYAMVTRSVVALACGVPVIHPPFTEVAPLVGEYDAGWLVEPADLAALGRVVDEVLEDRQVIAAKTANAQRLAADVFEPQRATEPLLGVLEEISPANYRT